MKLPTRLRYHYGMLYVSQLQEMEYGEHNSAFGASATGSADHIRTAVMRGTLRETDIFRSWTEITSHSKWSVEQTKAQRELPCQ